MLEIFRSFRGRGCQGPLSPLPPPLGRLAAGGEAVAAGVEAWVVAGAAAVAASAGSSGSCAVLLGRHLRLLFGGACVPSSERFGRFTLWDIIGSKRKQQVAVARLETGEHLARHRST